MIVTSSQNGRLAHTSDEREKSGLFLWENGL